MARSPTAYRQAGQEHGRTIPLADVMQRQGVLQDVNLSAAQVELHPVERETGHACRERGCEGQREPTERGFLIPVEKIGNGDTSGTSTASTVPIRAKPPSPIPGTAAMRTVIIFLDHAGRLRVY